MAFMNPIASLANFDSFSNEEELVENQSKKISYLPSHNVLAMLNNNGDVTVFSGKRQLTDDNGLKSLRPKANISLDGECAKSVCLVPVLTKKTTIVGRSWPCVVVGTTTGSLLFFNEEGILILRQNLFSLPVEYISTQIDSNLHGYLYASSAQSISLVSFGELASTLEMNTINLSVNPTPHETSAALNWKNLRLAQVKNIQQFMLTNTGAPESYFDQLERCTIDRYVGRGDVSNANNLLFSSVGSDPFYNFAISKEVSHTNLVSDIAVAVASKFTKMISDSVPFWGSKSAEPEPELHPKISSLATYYQHGIFDRDRLATSMCISPSKRFIALVDTLARVMLVDANTGVPIYIMKGYRRAQLGWITSSTSDGSGRSVELLVIYSAKSLQIEVWNTRKSSRVTAFSAPEGLGMLVYHSGSINAANNDDNFEPDDRQCYFLTQSGILYNICVSFSEALEFEDLAEIQGHLDDLVEIRKLLEDYSPDRIERISKLLKRFKRVQPLQQILKMICDCPTADRLLTEAVSTVVKEKTLRGIRKSTQRFQENLSKITRIVDLHDHIKQNFGNIETDVEQLALNSDLNTLKDQIDTFGGVFKFSPSSPPWIENVTLHEMLNCFNVLSDNLDATLYIEEEESREQLLYGIVTQMAADSSLYHLLSESQVCLWSLTRSILRGFFANYASSHDYDEWNKLYTVLKKLIEEVKLDDEEKLVGYLQNIYDEIVGTDNIPGAMVVCYVLKCALGGERTNQLEDEVTDTPQSKIFNGLYQQLQSILPLGALLRCRIDDESVIYNCNAKVFPISLKSLRKSQGHICDVVSQWICEQRLTYNDVKQTLNSTSMTTCLEAPIKENKISLATTLQLISDVRTSFPVSLQLETLLANCCWSYLCLWDKNYEEAQILQFSFDYLKGITAYKLKEGLCHMIWKIHMQSRIMSLTRLMEQSACIPQDSLLSKHVQVGKYSLEAFLTFCSNILDIIIESMLPSDEMEMLCPLTKEELMCVGSMHPVESEPSLIQRALSLPGVLRDTVHLHYSLVTILSNCARFNLNEVKPLSLFDSAGQSALSSDLCEVYTRYNQSSTINNHLVNARTLFLKRSIEACVHLLPECCHPNELLECQVSVSKMIDLAHSWNIDTDIVNKEYVMQLYSCGHDSLAKEVMCQISDKKILVEPLLKIIGLRTKFILGEIDNTTCERLGAMSTRLTRWIAEFPEESLESTKDLASTLCLIQCVLPLTTDNSTEEQLLNEIVLLLTNIQQDQ